VLALLLAAPALALPSLDELDADPAKRKELDRGRKALDKYFKAEFEQRKGAKAALATAIAAAEAEFLQWLGTTAGTVVGIDLRGQPDIVIDLLDWGRRKYLETRVKKGTLDYVKVAGAAGMRRLEYAVLVPKGYDPERRIPIAVSLHGRVINDRHPAFRSAPFAERAREVVWNNWLKTPAAEEVIVVGPTTNPEGFLFDENHFEDLQAVYRTLGEALTNYRGDWERVFLEVHGRALRVACEQTFMFAGFIVRDRVEDRKSPILPPEQFFLLENLNGVPLVYVADKAYWDKVGKPLADALTAAYQKAGKPESLVVIQAQRDVDGALRGGEDRIAQFVKAHHRPKVRESFTWRFFEQTHQAPFPVELTLMNDRNALDVNDAARNAPLQAKAGRLSFEARRETVKGEDGSEVQVNRIDLKVTEAEKLKILLYEPLVNFDLPLTVTVNGKPTEIASKKIERDWELFFGEILPRRFFMLPMLDVVEVSFELQPEFVAPEPAKPEEGAKPAEAGKPAEGSPAGGSAPPGGGPGDGGGAGAGTKGPK
jgi:hypothetical protein